METSLSDLPDVTVVAGSPTPGELEAVLAALAVVSARARAQAAAAEAVRRLPRQRSPQDRSCFAGWRPVLDRWSLHPDVVPAEECLRGAVSARTFVAS
jgi:hypothetical protein